MHLAVRCTRARLQATPTLWCRSPTHHTITTLAIETSCDDTSVAVISKHNGPPPPQTPLAQIRYHERITANNLAYRGIHPLASQQSHERNLANLIRNALTHLPHKPDFVSVTRGPGMRSSLNTGLNTAKGLALAWDVPLLGVHHMQAHALTPRLVSALSVAPGVRPEFPFMTLLVSGGHTLLLDSRDLASHPILATTVDIAIGDCIDKIARHVLPESVLGAAQSTMYGPVLEQFAYPTASLGGVLSVDYGYTPPGTRAEERERRMTRYGWAFTPPYAETRSGSKSRTSEYSFTGTVSAVKREAERRSLEGGFDEEERKVMAKEAMRIVFEHLASRVILALEAKKREGEEEKARTLVVSGGVAANSLLKVILRAFLDARGYTTVQLVFPPLELCTDNAAMIGWAGVEMYEAGWESSLDCQSFNKWSLDPTAEDGGILGVSGWERRKGHGH